GNELHTTNAAAMQRIVTGSFEDFAGAARGVSALMAEGFGHGDISIIALPARTAATRPPDRLRTGALVMGALGAMVGPGSVWAWAPDAGAMMFWAPSLGALAGASLGALLAVLLSGVEHAAAEAVSVVVDEKRASRVEAVLRAHGATLGRRWPRATAIRSRRSVDRVPPPRLVSYRP
ncbi:MAG TPA: hypothetical protein VII68_10075, partial [Casimicrobiaceae bacterium]